MARFAASTPQIASYMGDRPEFGALNQAGQDANTYERNIATEAEGFISATGLDSMEKVRSAGFKADAITKTAEAEASATQAQGMAGMVSSVAGGLGGLFK